MSITTKRKSIGFEDPASDDVSCKNKQSKPDDSLLALKGYYSYRKGERDDMQDSHVLLDCYDTKSQFLCNDVRISYYAVFDGHAGRRAADYCARCLHQILIAKIAKGSTVQCIEKDLKRNFIDSYKSIDEQFLADAAREKPAWKDGTTATTVLILNDTLYVANIGDSKAILVRYKSVEDKLIAIPLTKDHNPTLFEERMRIQKVGGVVKDGRIMGILEVSRSIGDGQYKKHGVTCIPDVKRCQLTSDDRYVLIGCDGLWKAFSAFQVVSFVQSIIEQQYEPTDDKTADQVRWETVANSLAAEGVRRRSGDNVTVVVVRIGLHSMQSNPNH